MGSLSFSIFGGNRVEGSPRLSGRYWYISVFEHNSLDLREAVFPPDEPVRINCICLIGGGQGAGTDGDYRGTGRTQPDRGKKS